MSFEIVDHELTHFIKQWSPEKFRTMANLLMEQYGKKGEPVEDLIYDQIAKAKRNGRTISREVAFEEVVADSMEAMLTSGDPASFMADLQQKDKTLWEKVKSWLQTLVKKLREVVTAYKGYKPDSNEGRMVAQMEDFIGVLQKAYGEALVDASENYRANEGKKNTTREGGNIDAEDVLFSERNDIVDVNGKEYESVIMLDKHVSKRVLSDPRAFSKFLAANLFNKKISVFDKNGDVEIIEFAGEKERVTKNGNRHQVRGELEYAKGATRRVIIANLEEVARYSSYDPVFSSDDNSHGWLDKNGWESRKTFVTDGDTIYEAYLKIGKAADGRNILYAVNCNVNNGIAVDKGATSERAAILSAMPSSGTLSHPDGGVNHKSMEKRSDRDPTAKATLKALDKQGKALEADVENLVEMLRLQGDVIKKDSSILSAARYLSTYHGVIGSKQDPALNKELAGLLKDFYSYLDTSEDLNWDNIAEKAKPVTEWIFKHTEAGWQRSEYARNIQ